MNDRYWHLVEYIWELKNEYPELTISEILVKLGLINLPYGVRRSIELGFNHLGPDVLGDRT